MNISFFDDEPEIYPLQYGGKARTIINLAKEFKEHPEVDKVKILSRTIDSKEKEFVVDGIKFIKLDDNNTIEKIAQEMQKTDILNIHCCSFTFPKLQGKAKKFYFLHDVLIATADKGSHLDKALGGQFEAIIAPSYFAKSIYEKNRSIINGTTECYVIPRHINEKMFYEISKREFESSDNIPQNIKDMVKQYNHVVFFPNRPIEEKGKQYLTELLEKLNKRYSKCCIIGPFEDIGKLSKGFINTGWIKSEEMKYFYSISDVTLNLSSLPESFSQVCIESVFCGTPIICFKTGNIPALNKLTESIILVEKDVNAILEGIDKAFKIKIDNEKTKVAKDIIKEEFNNKKIVNMYIELYKKYLKERNNV